MTLTSKALPYLMKKPMCGSLTILPDGNGGAYCPICGWESPPDFFKQTGLKFQRKIEARIEMHPRSRG